MMEPAGIVFRDILLFIVGVLGLMLSGLYGFDGILGMWVIGFLLIAGILLSMLAKFVSMISCNYLSIFKSSSIHTSGMGPYP